MRPSFPDPATVLRALGDAHPDLIYAKDRESRMLYANPATLRMVGHAADQVLGRSDIDWHHDRAQAETVVRNDREVMASGETHTCEETFFDASRGEDRLFRSTKTPMRDRSGAVIGLVGISHDITASHRAGMELRRLNEELEQRVLDEVARREAAQAQLAQAQRLEAIGQLTGGIAHDFNNLLQVISANLELLEPSLPRFDTTARARRVAALEGVHRGASLTRQLLAIARRQPLEPVTIAPRALLCGMSKTLRRMLGDGIDLTLDLAADLWNVFVDPAELERAVLNVAAVAQTAMPEGGRLTLAARNLSIGRDAPPPVAEMAAGDYVAISVGDTGAGLSPAALARAFEPFAGAGADGAGLGFAQAYGFARQSGGHVAVASTAGLGTVVRLYLARDVRSPVAPPASRQGAARGGSETVLVVEDDPRVRPAVVAMVESLGYRVMAAEDPLAALPLLRSATPVDLVFTDVLMPGPVSSVDLVREARALRPAIAVLFTSGYAEAGIINGGRLEPGVQLLSKPYGRDELARKLRLVLEPSPEADNDGAPGQRAPAASTGSAADAKLRILLVEDEALIRMVSAAMLEDEGHSVVEAGSGREALDAVAGDPAIDLLIVDLGLPDIGGSEVVARIRATRPGLPVIVASGRGSGGGEPDVVALPKPYDGAMLRAAVKRAMERVRAGSPGAV